jgi:hypothetical protein
MQWCREETQSFYIKGINAIAKFAYYDYKINFAVLFFSFCRSDHKTSSFPNISMILASTISIRRKFLQNSIYRQDSASQITE